MKKMNTEVQKANSARTQAERDTDSLRKQIDRLIEAQDTKAREVRGAQEGKRQMIEERDKARAEAEAAVKEMKRMEVELSKMEMGQQAARSLLMRLGESNTKRKFEE
jgi:chromosome segregation ATPase